MMMTTMRLNRAALFLLTISIAACGGNNTASPETGVSSVAANANQTTATSGANGNTVVAAADSKAPPANMGEAIDTAKFDADIARLEKQAEKNPGDDATRSALAKAYLARAGALTNARQYRVALGDYRRVLRYDPDNEEAQQMARTIVGIMKDMGREVPEEGDEPSPLPYNAETVEDDNKAVAPQSSSNSATTPGHQGLKRP